MLRTTHKAIAERIASELEFSEENTKIFIAGSTGPESHGDFPHATGHNNKILSKIDMARTLFLQNDEYSYGELANALHYIRDKWTHNPEAETEQVTIFDDKQFLKSVKELDIPKKAAEEYMSLANMLLFTKNSGNRGLIILGEFGIETTPVASMFLPTYWNLCFRPYNLTPQSPATKKP
jgi:hypothetical protein